MAQYGKNFYGSTYYGNTNAYSGIYETKYISTDETLKGSFTVNIDAILPDVYYKYDSPEIMQAAGTWTTKTGYIQSSSASAQLKFMATSDRVIINYQQNSTAPTSVSVQVTTAQPGVADVVTNYTFNPYSTTTNNNAQYIIDNLAYGMQTVLITLGSTNTDTFQFKGIEARVTNFTIETRASVNKANWTSYTKISQTKTARTGVTDGYVVSATSPNYTGKDYIQIRIHMATSDNETTLKLEDLETTSGDSNNRTLNGIWSAVFDMSSVASASGKTFQRVTEIDYTATAPDTTTLNIRSASSTNNLAYGPMSVPYKKKADGSPYNRLRLKKGFNEGYMDVPMISPGSAAYHTTTLRWDSWDDQSFLPPDIAGCAVTYIAMDNTKDETNDIYSILNPMDVALGNRSFLTSRLVDGRDFFLRIRLKRGRGKSTPAIDYIKLQSWMKYKQENHVRTFDSSPIDSNNTGEKYLTRLSNYTYNPPPEASTPEYRLLDQTGRPNDVNVYYAFEKNSMTRSYVTTSKSNGDIWVKAETRDVGGTKGIVKHYQYGGGTAKYPVKDEVEMAPIFTPSLDANVKYRYLLQSGWPTVYHTVVQGDTLDDIAIAYNYTFDQIKAVNPNPTYDNKGDLIVGQKIQIPNDTANPNIVLRWKTAGVLSGVVNLTDISGHNALLAGSTNLSSDIVQATVGTNATYGVVDWVSGEKIFDGVVNPNDIRSPYSRKHPTPASGDSVNISYTVLAGETYASIAKNFNIYELDIRIANSARDGQEPTAGQSIIIPAHITLPEIDPKAIIGDNPYEVTIVYNSVHKEDGTRLSEDVMVPAKLEIEWDDNARVTGEAVVRGPVANGKDLLGKPRVLEIISVADEDGFEWNPTVTVAGTTTQGSYKRTGNYVDWSNVNSATITEPVIGSTYYVTYRYSAPKSITVTIDSTYMEEGGVDHIWRSPEVKEFTGMCSPGVEHKAILPDFTEWRGVSDDPYVEDYEFIIEDNDLWVKTYIKEDSNINGMYYAIGTLQDRVPKDNWFPTIQTGYYYLSNNEFYLYSEPIMLEPSDREMPVAKNVTYVPGKFNNAAQVESGSTNLILNSGFDVATSKSTVFKLTF